MWNKIKQLYKRIRYRKAYNRLNELVKYESELVVNGNEAPEIVYFDAGELASTKFKYDLTNFNLSALSHEAKEKIIDIIREDRVKQLEKGPQQLENITDELTKLLNNK